MQKIVVYIRDTNGTARVDPENMQAKAYTRLLRQKTLSVKNVQTLQESGVIVEVSGTDRSISCYQLRAAINANNPKKGDRK